MTTKSHWNIEDLENIDSRERIQEGTTRKSTALDVTRIVERHGEPLPLAVHGGRTSPSPEAQAAIHRLFVRTPGEFVWQLFSTWSCIVAAVMFAEYSHSWWVSGLVIAFVATRQNILGLLMHEQCHRLAFHSKSGDRLCNLFAAYPLFVTLEGYRRVHLAHHQNYFTTDDPDYVRKQGEDWTFPQKLSRSLLNIMKDLSGLSTFDTIRGKRMENRKGQTSGRVRKTQTITRLIYYLVIAGLITSLHAWPIVLVYWIVPLFSVLQLIVRWGAICEHKYNLENPSVVESTPIIIPRWWERILLPNLNFTYHIYHHWYPRIPQHYLPDVHALFCREELVDSQNVFDGYIAYLRYLVTGSQKRNHT